jgi:hypothetical protein
MMTVHQAERRTVKIDAPKVVSQVYDFNKFQYYHIIAAHQALLLKLKLITISYCKSALASQHLMMTIIAAMEMMKLRMTMMIYIALTRIT